MDIAYRTPWGWKASNKVINALNERKAAHIDRVVNACHPPDVPLTQLTEDQIQMGILQLMEHGKQDYKKPMNDPYVNNIKATIDCMQLRATFEKRLDSLKPDGRQYIWLLQEEGKIPASGPFLFYMRLIGINPQGKLQKGMLIKRTKDGEIDPVKELMPYTGNDEIRYRFLVIHGAAAFIVGQINGKERYKMDAVKYVISRWVEFIDVALIAIYDGTWKDATDYALLSRGEFESGRDFWGPARMLWQLLDYYATTPVWMTKPPCMPSSTIEDMWNIILGSRLVTPEDKCMVSFTCYMNVHEQIIEMQRGGDGELCEKFSEQWTLAKKLGEAVITIKKGHGIGDTVITFPCGISATLAMRSRPPQLHLPAHSGEDTASKRIIGKWWSNLYRGLNTGKYCKLSDCPFFSFVAFPHQRFIRTRRIKVGARMEAREFPILSVSKMSDDNFCLANEMQKTITNCFGRHETRDQVMRAFRHAFVKLRHEISFIWNIAVLRQTVNFQADTELFGAIDELIAST